LEDPALNAHPSLESIAAFLDGKLKLAEREEVAQHIHDCAECYEVYAESVRFQGEERGERAQARVLPFRARWRERLRPDKAGEPGRPAEGRPGFRQIAYPVAACLTALLGFTAYRHFQDLGAPTLDSLGAQLAGGGNLSKLAWAPDANRGVGEGSPDPAVLSFQLGALLLDLRVAASEGNSKGIEKATGTLLPLFALTNFPAPEDKSRLDGAKSELEKPTPPRQDRLRAVRTFEEILSRQAPAREQFDLGLWTEAGKLAAQRGKAKYFQERQNQRFPATLSDKTLDARKGVRSLLDKISDAWNSAPSQADLDRLTELYKEVLKAYDDPDALGG